MKQTFGIFNPRNELVQNIPKILLNKVLLPESENCLLKDGKVIRRKMREPDFLNTEVKVQTPDGNPIIHYHTFIKRSTGTQYVLVFTKAHIYHWNPVTDAFDTKWTCSADCDHWETVSYNDKVLATNGVDKILVWNTVGDFSALDGANGIEYDTGKYLTKCKHLTTYENYLILGYTYENGSWYPQRMRWCAIGDETTWIPSGVVGGAGSTEVGKSDFFIGFGKYRGYLIVFKEKSHFKYWLVASTYTFNGANISMTIGAKCAGGIVNDNKGRLYWYASDGTIKEMSVGTISQPIQTEIIDLIYQSSVDLIKSKFIDETEETWWSIPFDNTLNNKVITLKEDEQGNRIWGQVDLAIPAFGEYKEE